EICLGQLRLTGNTVSLGLTDMTLQQAQDQGAKTLVIGTANSGGVIPESWQPTILAAAEMGLEIASGMHQRLSEFSPLAETQQRGLTKLHEVRHFDGDLKVGNGKPRQGKRLLTIGTDCSGGKMFAALAIKESIKQAGTSAQFKATGQTGILIAGSGISIDAVVADFISGAVEA
ncbi:EBNA-1 nuclear protein, partial [Arcobacter sp. FW59]